MSQEWNIAGDNINGSLLPIGLQQGKVVKR